MEGLERVQQIDDKNLHWKAEIAGVTREWSAEIVHQEPVQKENVKESIGRRKAATGAWRGSVQPTGEVDLGPKSDVN